MGIERHKRGSRSAFSSDSGAAAGLPPLPSPGPHRRDPGADQRPYSARAAREEAERRRAEEAAAEAAFAWLDPFGGAARQLFPVEPNKPDAWRVTRVFLSMMPSMSAKP